MNLSQEITKYEIPPSELIGKALKKVSYFEIDYGEPAFELSDHHSLDFGLQLETEEGDTYYLIWDSQFSPYDLKFKKGELRSELDPQSKIACHQVSHSSYWKERIGHKIKSIKSYWSYVKSSGSPDNRHYPQDLELSFDNGLNVIISAIEITPDGQFHGMADHISVFFDSETAMKYGAKYARD
jgi:hypothetical protein